MIAREILCPVDFSEASERAARFAVDLARTLCGTVQLAHVLPLVLPPLPVPELGLATDGIIPTDEQLSAETIASLHRLAATLGVEGARVHVATGSAAREILRIAKESGVGMIVMGSHGRTGLAHLLLGSVAERVIRGSRVPVLVVPSHGGPAPS